MSAVISFTWKPQWTYIMFYLYLNRTHKCQKCKYFKTRASVNICLEAIVKRRHCLTWFLTYCHELGVNGKHQKGKNFMFNPCVSKLPVYQYPLLKLYLQMNVDISICSIHAVRLFWFVIHQCLFWFLSLEKKIHIFLRIVYYLVVKWAFLDYFPDVSIHLAKFITREEGDDVQKHVFEV